MTTATITKIDAARRQLETAALLYFNNRDDLSAHTLAAAAAGILEPLAKAAGKQSFLEEGVLSYVPQDVVKTVREALRAPQNFLKHADRDTKETLTFSPRLTEFIMFEAMVTYGRITGEQPLLLEAFASWFMVSHPKVFPNPNKDVQEAIEAGKQLLPQGLLAFLELFLARKVRLLP